RGGQGPLCPRLPKSLRPCRLPSASVASFLTPSGSVVVAGGIPHTTQCTHSPDGASGSSQMSANALVPCGGAVHSNGGETSAPSQVCFFGMSPPWANDELFSSKPIAVLPGIANAESAHATSPTPLQPRRDTRGR